MLRTQPDAQSSSSTKHMVALRTAVKLATSHQAKTESFNCTRHGVLARFLLARFPGWWWGERPQLHLVPTSIWRHLAAGVRSGLSSHGADSRFWLGTPAAGVTQARKIPLLEDRHPLLSLAWARLSAQRPHWPARTLCTEKVRLGHQLSST